MIGWLHRIWHRPGDEIESTERFLQRLEDEARTRQAIGVALDRCYLEDAQRGEPSARPTTFVRKLARVK